MGAKTDPRGASVDEVRLYVPGTASVGRPHRRDGCVWCLWSGTCEREPAGRERGPADGSGEPPDAESEGAGSGQPKRCGPRPCSEDVQGGAVYMAGNYKG